MKYSLLLVLCFAIACTTTNVTRHDFAPKESIVVNGKMFTALYQQHSAEYKALCLQAYHVASEKLIQSVSSTSTQTGLPKAIITDIDETVLDNSAFAVHQSLMGKEYVAADWYAWTDKSMADTVPGASSFLKLAAAKGVEIFYITNREERERASTLKNLQRFALPNADERHLITKNGTSSKEVRRQQVAATHEIIMLIGDNLADFSNLFDKKSQQERSANTDLSSDQFGNRFIVIPNPGYGDWEGALFNYNYKLSVAQKDSIIRSVLKNY